MASARGEPAAATVEGLRALAGSFDVVFCDVFGTIHDADGVFPTAVDALRRFRVGGGTVLLVSNSPSPAPELARTLLTRGVPETCFDAIVTSADVARGMLAERGVRLLHHIGLPQERCLFEGLDVRLAPVAEAEVVVCTGCPDGALPEEALASAAARRLDLLCTNPDTEIAAGPRTLRFAGLVAARYEALGGTVVATGKPGAAIYAAANARVGTQRGAAVEPERTLAIGDTPHLDVAGAIAMGFRALRVGQGASDPAADELPAAGTFRLPTLAW